MPSAAAAEQPSLLGDEPTASVTGPRTRAGDPRTSHRAAEIAAGSRDLSKTQENVLAIIQFRRGATDDEILAEWNLAVSNGILPKKTPQRLRTCRADLVKLKYVRESGSLRPSANGNPAIVWTAAARP